LLQLLTAGCGPHPPTGIRLVPGLCGQHDPAQGQAIFRALAEVSPDVISTLHASTKAPN
jgi:hypothetical protein